MGGRVRSWKKGTQEPHWGEQGGREQGQGEKKKRKFLRRAKGRTTRDSPNTEGKEPTDNGSGGSKTGEMGGKTIRKTLR